MERQTLTKKQYMGNAVNILQNIPIPIAMDDMIKEPIKVALGCIFMAIQLEEQEEAEKAKRAEEKVVKEPENVEACEGQTAMDLDPRPVLELVEMEENQNGTESDT